MVLDDTSGTGKENTSDNPRSGKIMMSAFWNMTTIWSKSDVRHLTVSKKIKKKNLPPIPKEEKNF